MDFSLAKLTQNDKILVILSDSEVSIQKTESGLLNLWIFRSFYSLKMTAVWIFLLWLAPCSPLCRFVLTHSAQNDKSAVIARFANLKRAFARHYQQSTKTLLIVIASKVQALRGNPQIQKQTLFKPLLYDKTQPNPLQSLILRQYKTQPTLFAKKRLIFNALRLEISNERI